MAKRQTKTPDRRAGATPPHPRVSRAAQSPPDPVSGGTTGTGKRERSAVASHRPGGRAVTLLGVLVPALLLVGTWWVRTHRAPPQASALDGAVGEEARLREAAARSPQETSARQALGRYYLDRDQPFEAVWELGAARQLQPDDPMISLQLAVALASGQLYVPGIEQLEALAARQPPTREGRVQLATLRMARLQFRQALSALQSAPDVARWPEGQRALGRVYEAMGQTEPAILAYQRAGRLAPASSDGEYRLGSLYLRAGRLAEARAALEAAGRKTAQKAPILTRLAETDTGRGDAVGAERRLRAAVAANSGYVPALVALGRLCYRRHRPREALPAYRHALELAPGDAEANEGIADLLQAAGHPADAHAARARAFRTRGLPARAVAEYEALARQPEHEVDAVLEMSLVLVQMQQNARAVRAVAAALARHPQEAALHERLAILLLLLPDRTQAQRRCEEWQRLEPRSLRPVWVIGKIAADGGELDRAVRLLQQAVNGEPDNMEYAATLAETLLSRGSRPDLFHARELLERVTASSIAEAKSYFNLGQVLWRLKEPESARWAFLRSLDLDPNVAETYAILVRLARQLGQSEQVRFWSEIVRNVEERLRQELLRSRRTWDQPEEPVGHRDMALFLIQTGELRKAESHLQEALRGRPGWSEAEQLLATVRRTRELLE